MVVNILAFGVVKEIFGGNTASIEVSGATSVEEIISSIKKLYPKINTLKSFAIAVNGAYATPGTIIKEGDEVAIIPPVSGG